MLFANTGLLSNVLPVDFIQKIYGLLFKSVYTCFIKRLMHSRSDPLLSIISDISVALV